MASLFDLVQLIRTEASELSENDSVDGKPSFFALFQDSISESMKEIKTGTDSDAFPDLVVINLIIASAKVNYSAKEIKEFVDQFADDRNKVEPSKGKSESTSSAEEST